MGSIGNKGDGATITLSVIALLIATVFSINSFSGQSSETAISNSPDPFDQAQNAAQAGIEIAKWHIECNGYVTRGSLAPRFWINGATYTVEWDDVNMADSTVIIRSKGEVQSPDGMTNGSVRTAKIKLSFFPGQKNGILNEYYSKARPSIAGSK